MPGIARQQFQNLIHSISLPNIKKNVWKSSGEYHSNY